MRRILLILSLLMSGCSSVSFVASENTPFNISAIHNSEEERTTEGTVDFFFWGMSPGNRKVYLEDATKGLGLSRPGHVSIEQSVGFKSLMLTLVTFGLYCPVDYKITVLSEMVRPEE